MLSTSKNAGARMIIKAKGHQHQWLAGGYDLERGHFRGDSMVVTWRIVAFLPRVSSVYLVKTIFY